MNQTFTARLLPRPRWLRSIFQLALVLGLISCAGAPAVVSPGPAQAGARPSATTAAVMTSTAPATVTLAPATGIAGNSAVGGQATLGNVQVSGSAKGGLLNDAPSWHFTPVRGDGNSGW